MLLHVIAEVARHVGHLDVLREQLDGVTGYLGNVGPPAEGSAGRAPPHANGPARV